MYASRLATSRSKAMSVIVSGHADLLKVDIYGVVHSIRRCGMRNSKDDSLREAHDFGRFAAGHQWLRWLQVEDRA
ncbi:hypothetical protein GCM10009662_82570 [Catellatospora coxensis]|uniref:Uncharacterized protein n=1 Tax=Catellatospora coxensis TaxID=310354 RepID=A0A8J3LE66_9ACTN|nr:hypothetical protein Cco03nite_77550 [Catellatospora coxensis]